MTVPAHSESMRTGLATALISVWSGALLALTLTYASSASGKQAFATIGLVALIGLSAVFTLWTRVFESATLFALSATLAVSIKYHPIFRADHIGGAIGIQITITHVLAVLLLLFYWVSQNERKAWKISIDRPIALSFGVYFLLALFSTFGAKDIELGIFELVTLVQSFLLFVFVANILTTRRRVALFVSGLLVGLALQSGVALIQKQFPGRFNFQFAGGRQDTEQADAQGNLDLPDQDLGTTMVQGQIERRPTGLLIHPNVLGLYLTLTIPLAVAVLLLAESRWSQLLAGGALALGVYALYLSLSRSAWAGTALALLMCAYLGHRLKLTFNWQQRLVIAVACLAVAGIIAAKSSLILHRITGTAGEAVDFRLNLDRAAVQMLEDHPFFGIGLNNFTGFIEQYDTTGMSHYTQFPVHLLYLLEASETGILGGIAFLIFVAVTCIHGYRLSLLAHSLEYRVLGAFLVAGLIGFWFAETTGFVYRIPIVTTYVWCCLGLICALPKLESQVTA